MHVYANIERSNVWLQPALDEVDLRILETKLDDIMRNAFVEVTTRRGGYHDTCDIQDSEYVRWDRLPEDQQYELIEQEVKEWAQKQGHTVLEVNIF